MRYLLYCIFHAPTGADPSTLLTIGPCVCSRAETLLGVGGQPVSLIAKNGLSAAISRISHSDLTLGIPTILAYEKVIESFHRHPAVRGVIPMRYGCLFEEESQISRFLEEHCQEFEALLKDLEGCVEMGIRILLAEWGMANGEWKMENSPSEIRNPESLTPGRAYLAGRKSYYEQEDQFGKKIDEVAERCRKAFSGLFVKCKTERPPLGTVHSLFRIPALSLYFLVPKKSVEPFRQVFRHLSSNESAKFLLSGPWPPYNFVLPDQTSLPECFRGSGQKRGVLL